MEFAKNLITNNSTTKNSLGEVVRVFERKYPLDLAESWDNVGLLVEPPGLMTIHSILFTNDLTENVLDEAISKNINMIYSYHPPIFSSIKSLKLNEWKSNIIMKCIQARIAIFSSHTASDAIVGGVNDWLIGCFEMKDTSPIKRNLHLDSEGYKVRCKKMTDECKQIMQKIPNVRIYEDSSDQSYEFIEVENKHFRTILHEATETKKLNFCTYEQVVIPACCGMGRVGQLKVPLKISVAINIIKRHLQLTNVRVSFGKCHTLESTVESIAVCAGSGGTVLRGVFADLYITGEMSHHELLEASHNNVTVILCEHSNTERGYLKELIEDLAIELKDIQLILAENDKDPIGIV